MHIDIPPEVECVAHSKRGLVEAVFEVFMLQLLESLGLSI